MSKGNDEEQDVGGARAQSVQVLEEHALEWKEIALLRATLEATADAILLTADDSTIADYNDNYLRLWRLEGRSWRGLKHARVLEQISGHFGDPAQFRARIEDIYASSREEERDVLHLIDGSAIERVSKKITVEDHFVGHVWTFRDVTKHIKVEESLRRQKHTLELLNKTAAALISKQDIQPIVQAVTDAATDLIGAEFGAFFHNTADEQEKAYTLSGARRDKFAGLSPHASALSGPIFRGERIIRADDVLEHPEYGKLAPFQGTSSHLPLRSYLAVPVVSRGGDVHGGLFFAHSMRNAFTEEHEMLVRSMAAQAAITIDNARFIDAHLQAKQQLEKLNDKLEERVIERTKQLQRSEQQFQQLVAGVTDAAIFMLDRDGRVVSWNTGAERIKGYRSEEIIGKHFSLFYTPEDRADGVPRRALAVADATGKYDAEGWRVRKDGSRFWSVLIDPLRAPDGTLVGFAKVTRDMTERRSIIEQLHQSQKMEAIGQLTGGVAHDFNNLLTVIMGSLDTLLQQLPPSEGRWRRAADHAMRSAQRAATLTQQLLAFARRQPLNPKPTDVNRLVSGITDLIRRTLSEDIALETLLAAGAWQVDVDPHQLESALLNLAVNARDAMPHGGKLTVETSNVYLDERYAANVAEITPGQYVLICVSDTGVGMSEEVLSRAFDPFFTTKPMGKGTGLGLSQVFGFVKQSGGHVRLYSQVGKGTAVRIYLPRLTRRSEFPEEEGKAILPSAEGTETVLVVEDEEDVRMYSTESLRELGFSVLEAQDGRAALHLLKTRPQIDLLFTDVGLPALNGRELVEEARRLHPNLKVLFTTGYARDAIVHQGRLDEGIDLLTKPFTRAQLGVRIRNVLDADRPTAGQPLALVVEDERLVRMFVLEALTDMGFAVIQASTAREGMTLAERTRNLGFAVIDIGLPDRSGLLLAADLRAALPQMGIAIASGYGQEAQGSLRDDARVTFLTKPFRAETLKDAVQRLRAASR